MEAVRLPLDAIVDDGCSASAAQDVVCGGAALQQVSVGGLGVYLKGFRVHIYVSAAFVTPCTVG
jgi:hypothetical protein